MAIRLCPECGKKCSTTRDDCPHCGYVFVKEKICPECESSIPADATECPECGFTFETEEKTPANMPEVPMEDPAPKAKIVAMTCPNCGATEAIQLGEDRFKCQCCGTPFAYDKGPSTVVNGDVIVQQTKNGLPRGVSGKTFTGCYKIDYLTSEDDAKLILLESAYNKDAIDYVDMRIKNVTKLILPMAVAHYAFDIKYQVLIGNDRKEQYVAMEKVRENGQEFTRPVTKERTVTDWRPFEGTVKPTTSDGWWNKSPELPTTDISPALVLYCYADWLKKLNPMTGKSSRTCPNLILTFQ